MKIKGARFTCIITSAVAAVIVFWFLMPFVLACVLAAVMPLLDRLDDGLTLLWLLSAIEIVVIITLFLASLLFLHQIFQENRRLISILYAFFAAIFLLFMYLPSFSTVLFIVRFGIPVFLIFVISTLFALRKPV